MIEIKSRNDVFRHLQHQLTENKTIMPSLPQVLVRVQKAVSDQGMGAKDLADVILDDPSLTASVLRLANSAYYRHSKTKIRTITSAIVLLGFETLRNLALGLSVYNMLSNLPKVRNYQQVWRHSLCCAVSAKQFASHLRLSIPEEAFVAGLLHDMGKLVLGQFFPEHYTQVQNQVEDHGIGYVEAEQAILQTNHLEVGQFIAQHWSFPDEILDAIGNHELLPGTETIDTTAPMLTRIVAVANQVALYLYQPREQTRGRVTLPMLKRLCDSGLGVESDALDQILLEMKGQVSDIARLLDIVMDDWRYDPSAEPSAKATSQHAPVVADPHAQRDHARLNFLLHCNNVSSNCVDVAEFLQQTVEQLFDVLELSSVFLLTHNRDKHVLEAKLGFGPDVERVRKRIIIHVDTTDDVAARAFVQRSPVVVSNDNLALFARLSEANLVSLLGSFNLAATPILVNDRVIGVLVISRSYDAPNISHEDMGIVSLYVQTLTTIVTHSRRKAGKTGTMHATEPPTTHLIRKGQTNFINKKSDPGGTHA